nr:hypothetical protein [Tanacetum cinerariifolium]
MVSDDETVSAEDEPTLGRPYQPCPDVVFYKPEGQFLNDSLEEDGLQSDVNFDIWNEMNKSMDIEDESDSQYNTSFT